VRSYRERPTHIHQLSLLAYLALAPQPLSLWQQDHQTLDQSRGVTSVRSELATADRVVCVAECYGGRR
jgi:hypothetical protein